MSAPSIDGAEDENMDSEPLPTPETVDPRQQTISKFFKPAPSSRTHSSSHHTSQRPDNRLPVNSGLLQPYSLHTDSPMMSLGSDNTHSPSSGITGTDMDMDMDMDMDSGSDESAQGFQRANGGFGWM